MRINIDIKASIQKGRLKPNNLSWENYSSIGIYVLLAAVCIFVGLVLPTLLLFEMMKQNNNPNVLWFMLAFYVLGILTLYGLIKDNKLRSFHGKDTGTNKRTMISLLKDKFKTDLVYEGEEILTYYKRPTFWTFGTRVIVCFNHDEVLINISKFSQYGIKSFFHELIVERTMNSIIKEFHSRVGS